MALQISIHRLEQIIDVAKKESKLQNASQVLEIEIVKPTELHLGDDSVKVSLRSKYSECNSISIKLE